MKLFHVVGEQRQRVIVTIEHEPPDEDLLNAVRHEPLAGLPESDTHTITFVPVKDDSNCTPLPDTLPEWLYNRFGQAPWRTGGASPEWAHLADPQKNHWEREAAAVRKAVSRNGVKQEGSAHA